MTVTRGDQVRQEDLGAMDDTEQVDADHLVVDREVGIADRLAGGDAGVVVELMNDTELTGDGLRVGDEGLTVGHVQVLLG